MFGKKRGGTHVGVMLSFVIFVTFLIFLYSTIQPLIKTKKEKQSLLDFLKVELIKKFSADLTTVTISVDDSVSYSTETDCLEVLDNSVGVGPGLSSIVNDDRGNIVSSNRQNDKLIIEWGDHAKTFFKIYYSGQLFEKRETTNNNCISPKI